MISLTGYDNYSTQIFTILLYTDSNLNKYNLAGVKKYLSNKQIFTQVLRDKNFSRFTKDFSLIRLACQWRTQDLIEGGADCLAYSEPSGSPGVLPSENF